MSGSVAIQGQDGGESGLGSSLESLLSSPEIVPGSTPSYELCKAVWLYHPLGAKIVETPVKLAQSQARIITIQDGPEERVRDAFVEEWRRLRCDFHAFNTKVQSRVYGVSTLIVGTTKTPTAEPLDPWKLWEQEVYLSTFDPLNTGGSLVLNQDPNAPDFQKVVDIRAAGQLYHRSRSIVVMNEAPVYIAYTSSGFGYVGRSAYQRILFPLKSFLNTMIADDMVARKVGLIVAKMKPPGSVVSRMMQRLQAIKRILLRQGQTNQVLGITTEESVESLNLQNLEGPHKLCRQNILENVATGAPMPVKLITQESFAEGFGEGEEDAKYIAHYIDAVREDMAPLYAFLDDIVQFRAWNPEFYATIQKEFPEWRKVPFETAFYRWRRSFSATWPSLLTEPESEQIKVDDTRFKAISAMVELLMPNLDPDNKAALIQWAVDNFNERKKLISSPLLLNMPELLDHLRAEKEKADAMPAPGAGGVDEGQEPKPAKPPSFARAA